MSLHHEERSNQMWSTRTGAGGHSQVRKRQATQAPANKPETQPCRPATERDHRIAAPSPRASPPEIHNITHHPLSLLNNAVLDNRGDRTYLQHLTHGAASRGGLGRIALRLLPSVHLKDPNIRERSRRGE